MNNPQTQNNQTNQPEALGSVSTQEIGLQPNNVTDQPKGNTSEKQIEEPYALMLKANRKVEDLPPPEGINPKYVQAVSSPTVDDTLYKYTDLAKRLGQEPKRERVTSGFVELDSMIDGGFEGGELIILSGPTKSGKSTMAQTMAYYQAKQDLPSVLFTLEMGWREFTKKFQDMDLDSKESGGPTDLPMFYPIDNRALTLKWLEAQVEKAIKKHGARIVYIDHLHFLLPLKDYRNTSFLIGSIVREVKRIAVKFDIPVVMIAHTTKLQTSVTPDINALRDSGLIACEADLVLMMWRERAPSNQKDSEETYLPTAWVSLEANRRTGTTKKFKIGHYNHHFYSYNDYLELVENDKRFNLTDLKQTQAEIKAKKLGLVITSEAIKLW